MMLSAATMPDLVRLATLQTSFRSGTMALHCESADFFLPSPQQCQCHLAIRVIDANNSGVAAGLWLQEPGSLDRTLSTDTNGDCFFRCQATALDDKFAEAHLNLGNLLTRMHRDREAVDELRKVVSTEPTNEKALAFLGEALFVASR